MVFQIDKRGLFMMEFTDHHAILGVSVDADAKEIRKSYLKIARRLHPDSGTAVDEEAKQFASQLLSKLVNPAWEQLSQEKNRIEHGLLLKLKGQSALRKQNEINILSSLAKQLATNNISTLDHFYRSALQDMTDRQYSQLDQALEITAQISELNLVYLMRREGQGETVSTTSTKQIFTGTVSQSTAAAKSAQSAQPAPPPPRRESMADQYYRRAEEFYSKGNFPRATLELRDALKIEPNNSRCHSLMGMVYLRQGQGTMAKIHFNKALEADPKNEMAIVGKQNLERAANRAAGSTQSAKSPSKSDQDKPNGGLFGGMFGGKKK
jgi:curved DNA-binding protein CbpA